jgi:hypothetical protein
MAVTLTTTITGSGATALTNINIINLVEKLEENLLIKDTDSWQTINLSRIEEAKILLFKSTGEFTLELTIGGNAFPLTGNMFTFVLDDDGVTLASITLVRISTTSTTDITVNCVILGQAA